MTDGTGILEATAAPPIVLDPSRSRRVRSPELLPPLARLACALVGLALPALGIAVADTVHRVGEPRATQAAAPAIPSGGAAVPSAGRASGPVRATLLNHVPTDDTRREVRP